MEINPLGNETYQVIYDGKMETMSLNEVMFLLSRPAPKKGEKTNQELMEEFWAGDPWYMT